MTGEADGESQNLRIKVTDVKVTDDVAILDPVFMDRDMLDVDENGNFFRIRFLTSKPETASIRSMRS